VLVDVTNKVGVDINRAVADTYYRRLLPFVCGLGPRKAQALVEKISAAASTINGFRTTYSRDYRVEVL
jgi:transcription elongation factor SPT6